ncbi:MAG: hypothetical protein ACLTJG_17230 [[Clostridium] innocuum]
MPAGQILLDYDSRRKCIFLKKERLNMEKWWNERFSNRRDWILDHLKIESNN